MTSAVIVEHPFLAGVAGPEVGDRLAMGRGVAEHEARRDRQVAVEELQGRGDLTAVPKLRVDVLVRREGNRSAIDRVLAGVAVVGP